MSTARHWFWANRQRFSRRNVCCVGLVLAISLLAVGTIFFNKLARLRDAYTDPGKQVVNFCL